MMEREIVDKLRIVLTDGTEYIVEDEEQIGLIIGQFEIDGWVIKLKHKGYNIIFNREHMVRVEHWRDYKSMRDDK